MYMYVLKKYVYSVCICINTVYSRSKCAAHRLDFSKDLSGLTFVSYLFGTKAKHASLWESDPIHVLPATPNVTYLYHTGSWLHISMIAGFRVFCPYNRYTATVRFGMKTACI